VTRRANRLVELACRHALGLLMAALLIAAVCYSIFNLYYAPSYAIGDWLINYSQGFVRRGLSGEVILLLGHALHLPLPWTALLIEIPAYAAFLAGVYRLAAPLRRDVLWYCLLFSPASLPFMILNSPNGCRKEVLLFAALAGVLLMVRRGLDGVALSLTVTAILAVLVLSHDALFCCFPYFVAAVALKTGGVRKLARVFALPLVTTGALMNLVRTHPGNMALAQGICRSVGGRWITVDDTRDLCAGAIRHISWTVQQSRSEELRNIHYWPLFLCTGLLSLIPFVAAVVRLYRRDTQRRAVQIISWTAVLCAALSSVLFYLTIDWGRWIHMQLICMLLVTLFAANSAPSFLPPPSGAAHHASPGTLLRIAAILYCTCWTLPVYGGYNLRFGYFDVARFFHHEIPFLRSIDAAHTIDRGW
jgi:hypothetical protein